MNTRLSLGLSVLIALTLLSSCTQPSGNPPQVGGGRNAPTQQACTEDAKVCPDGSSVGRTGPNCEFTACPSSPSSGSSGSTSTQTPAKSETVSYSTPGGDAQVKFSVTLDGDTITTASAEPVSGDHKSRQYQSRFAQRLASAVVGKKVSELSLDAIGGASLTTTAFTRFIQQQ